MYLNEKEIHVIIVIRIKIVISSCNFWMKILNYILLPFMYRCIILIDYCTFNFVIFSICTYVKKCEDLDLIIIREYKIMNSEKENKKEDCVDELSIEKENSIYKLLNVFCLYRLNMCYTLHDDWISRSERIEKRLTKKKKKRIKRFNLVFFPFSNLFLPKSS